MREVKSAASENSGHTSSKTACIHFPMCGGCTHLDLSYEEQIFKKQQLIEQRFGTYKNRILPIIQSDHPLNYRHKVQLPFGTNMAGKPTIGCYARDSHTIIDQNMCKVQDDDLSTIAWTVREWAKTCRLSVYNEKTGNGFLRYLLMRKALHSGEVLLGLVTNGSRIGGTRQMSTRLLEMIARKELTNSTVVGIVQNINTRFTNVVLGEKENIWWGRPYVKECLGGIKYKIELSTFFQVNPYQTPRLYDEVKVHIPDTAKVLDLYCGVGSIALWVAKKTVLTIGIEENKTSVTAARAAAILNGMDNVRFVAGDAEVEVARYADDGFTCAIVDPPRKGLGSSLIVSLIASSLKRIIYVSCNPDTLARDTALLEPAFSLVSIRGVDMFPQTEHIECIAVFDRY